MSNEDEVWKQQQLSPEEIKQLRELVGEAEEGLEKTREKVVGSQKKTDEPSVGEDGSDEVASFADRYANRPEGTRSL